MISLARVPRVHDAVRQPQDLLRAVGAGDRHELSPVGVVDTDGADVITT